MTTVTIPTTIATVHGTIGMPRTDYPHSMAQLSRERIGEVRDIVAAHLPGYPLDPVLPIGEGQDNRAYEVGGELIVRFRKEEDGERLEREARLLAIIGAISPLPVPRPVLIDRDQGCLAYRKLPGVPLLELPERAGHAAEIAARLGQFLAVLHAMPVEPLAGLVGVDDQEPAGWRRDAEELYRTIAPEVPATHRAAVEAFLAAPPPEPGSATVFSHNDLGIEHVLVDPVGWTVTGILDWTDAAIVDPAYDFGLIYRDLGPDGLDAALGRYPQEPADAATLRLRAAFYARCAVLEDLAYGLSTGRTGYLDAARAALDWLFVP
jgi:aminoglycoside phosphotransferase (APT) family kinase protein